MALNWINKTDGVDDILAEDVNALAAAITANEIETGKKTNSLDTYTKAEINAILANYASKSEIASVYKVKGSIWESSDLSPISFYKRGDVINYAGPNTIYTYDVAADNLNITEVIPGTYMINFSNAQAICEMGDYVSLTVNGSVINSPIISVTDSYITTNLDEGLENITEIAIKNISLTLNTGGNIVCLGNCWDNFSATFDLSGYYTKAEIDALLASH